MCHPYVRNFCKVGGGGKTRAEPFCMIFVQYDRFSPWGAPSRIVETAAFCFLLSAFTALIIMHRDTSGQI